MLIKHISVEGGVGEGVEQTTLKLKLNFALIDFTYYLENIYNGYTYFAY